MRRSEFSTPPGRARAAAALLVLLALAGSLLPASQARQVEGRPRRVGNAAAPAQQPQPAQTRQTPTPTPRPAPPVGPSVTIQDAPPPPPAPPKLRTQPVAEPDAPQQDESGQEVNPEEVVTIDASLVNLHVRVVDRNNHPISDVAEADFRVTENGVPQQVQFVTREEVPITYGLVVDNSGSLRSQIGQVIEAAKTIVESNKPGDETFVVRFISSDEIKIMQDFTSDKQAISDALDDMFIEGGQTAVIDAAYLSAEHADSRRKKTGDPAEDKRRRALILVTDGEDRNSFYKTEQLFEALKESDVQIFVIGFVNELEKERGFISKSKRDKAVSLLDRMAKETGGRAFYPTSLSELPGIAEQITKDLRTQYVVSYRPATKGRPGEFRPVRVSVADGPGGAKRIAVTRSGYTAKPGQAAPAPAPPSKANATPAGRRP
ncbi:MAG TPA: VWA domain-containing protein [Pyrinomonadaceae bacterium]|nr:VWA domain-containing protein [Pyrinomonadaceae bacterium]